MRMKESFGLWWLASFIAFAYLWGVLSIQHYYPSTTDLYISIYVGGFLAAGLAGWGISSKTVSLSINTWLWLCFLVLILLQPILNKVAYSDGLVFPAATILFCLILSAVIASFTNEQKQFVIQIMAAALLVGSVLVVATQFIQLMWPDSPVIGTLVYPRDSNNRLIGNIAQVNQAAFVSALGIAAAIYFSYRSRSKIKIGICMILVVWLAMGIGFSASRGGVLLTIAAVLGGGFWYSAQWRRRLISVFGFGALSIIGYNVGSRLLLLFIESGNTALSRLANETVQLRKYLLQEAWLAIKMDWLTGVGWGGLQGFGLEHAEDLPWFTVAHHAHNLFAQVGAELGILGLTILCGFIWVLIRNFRICLPPYRAFAFSALTLIGMYSLSEYPLWFLRFIMITAIFIEIISAEENKNKRSLRLPVLVISSLLLVGSVYYATQYNKLAEIIRFIDSDDISTEQKLEAYPQYPAAFGFAEEKELILFTLLPISENNLAEHIVLGERVASKNFDQGLLLKQASLLAISGNSERADHYFRAACLMNMLEECDKVNKFLIDISEENPSYYKPYLERFREWYKVRFHKRIDEGQ